MQLDLKKAFDRLKHSAVLAALRSQGASVQCIAVFAALLRDTKASVSLSGVTADPMNLKRGLPQGAPESPVLFTLVTDMVLKRLIKNWKEKGLGWNFDGFTLLAVCYDDDILLFASSQQSLEAMVSDVIDAFLEVGLEVGMDKSHWTSFPAKPGSKLKCGTSRVKWEDHLTFIGTVLNFCGNDGLAIEYRLAQATKVFYKWKDVLQCEAASVKLRVELGMSTFMSAAMWLAETWHPTAAQVQRLNSWAARMMARLARIKPLRQESIGDYWRRLHRFGHHCMDGIGGSLEVYRRGKLHAFAGHLARMQDGIVSIALRTRCLAWWRAAQSHQIFRHPARFHPWRWEQQLEDFFGQARTLFIDDNVGWMQRAEDRGVWRRTREVFAKSV